MRNDTFSRPEAGAPGSAGLRPAKGWYSRGYLPHLDTPGLLQVVTFRFADSLPKDVLDRLREEAKDETEWRRRIDTSLDAGYGACWLRRDDLADIVEEALLHFDGQRYRLIAWCVMPNHVHALLEVWERRPLAGIVHSWKSFTAKTINAILGRVGPLWQRDYYDRYVRDDRHLRAVIEYIESNPVKAGLVAEAASWRYSSAARKMPAESRRSLESEASGHGD
jgi:Transposase and inactivated derivatives